MSAGICLCGGPTVFYDGSLGYEAMVCQKCGFHWTGKSQEEHAKQQREYVEGLRAALTLAYPYLTKHVCTAPTERGKDKEFADLNKAMEAIDRALGRQP